MNDRNTVNNKNNRQNKKDDKKRFPLYMQKKLVVLCLIVLLAFVGLGVRLVLIQYENGEQYKKMILSQQDYKSSTIVYRRGSILDANGTTLAASQKVYNLVIDSKVIMSNPKYLDPTVSALVRCFDFDPITIKAYIQEHKNSSYYVPLKRMTYDEISEFQNIQADTKNNPYVQGVWFEEEYKRYYPYGSLACDAIGFTTSDGVGMYGLEQYYNETLTGINGREYGYLNDDSNVERTTIEPTNGHTIVSTLDVTIQGVVEKCLKEFNAEHENEYRKGAGSENIACIVMNPNNGEIYAMASLGDFDLNNPYDLSGYYTEAQLDAMDTDAYYEALNNLWSNFCITSTYEPGSTAKPFTIASALEVGAIRGNEYYECKGSLVVADYTINCNNKYGHGSLSVSQSLEQSCNVALMHMGRSLGKEDFLRFQDSFGFGYRTNVDLAGVAKTASLVYNSETMNVVELATSSFGQGYNVTMVQMAAAFASLINGGYYYEPHMVSKILTDDGALVQEIDPRVLRQTISTTTSDEMREYLNAVVDSGTGAAAKPYGYSIGGKTGTAEMAGRDKENYVVSFIGYAPADNPQVLVYVVIDRPNTEDQAHAYYASGVFKNIMQEILPYMNIYMTEELTQDQIVELAQRGLYPYVNELENIITDETTQDDSIGENQ